MNGKVTAIPIAAATERNPRSFCYLESEFEGHLSSKRVLGGAFHAPLVDFNQSTNEPHHWALNCLRVSNRSRAHGRKTYRHSHLYQSQTFDQLRAKITVR